MNGDYAWWFLVVGLCGGAVLVWILRGQMARTEEDVSAAERAVEVEWISRTIEDAGGIAPVDLVDQVLMLHRSYLREAEPFEVQGVAGTSSPGHRPQAVDEHASAAGVDRAGAAQADRADAARADRSDAAEAQGGRA